MTQTPTQDLLEEDRIRITEIFQEDIAPRLLRMDARVGSICCEFAGSEFRNWVLQFNSSRFGLEVVDFFYDEDARTFDLPNLIEIKDH